MWTKTKLTDQNVLISVAFLVVVPTVAHLLFSWRGFAPVDDGFTLAYSRRILEGQIPHRDFIIIRPFLSPLIHTPFAASVHYFVLTAWHTVDGLFLSSIGLWILLTQKHTTRRIAGYLLIAAAYLTKQSFLFVAPLSVLLLGDWR